jgi:predicted transcriptional regulator YdeE
MIISKEVVQYPAFNIIGIQVRTNNNEAVTTVPTLWQQWHNNNIFQKIPHKMNKAQYFAVYTDYDSDQYGDYILIIGAHVSTLTDIPTGCVGRFVPSASYIKYDISGTVPVCIIDAWHSIWSSEISKQRAFTYDFEVYPVNAPDKDSPTAHIFVAIK